jgi:hypothetical protein
MESSLGPAFGEALGGILIVILMPYWSSWTMDSSGESLLKVALVLLHTFGILKLEVELVVVWFER